AKAKTKADLIHPYSRCGHQFGIRQPWNRNSHKWTLQLKNKPKLLFNLKLLSFRSFPVKRVKKRRNVEQNKPLSHVNRRANPPPRSKRHSVPRNHRGLAVPMRHKKRKSRVKPKTRSLFSFNGSSPHHPRHDVEDREEDLLSEVYGRPVASHFRHVNNGLSGFFAASGVRSLESRRGEHLHDAELTRPEDVFSTVSVDLPYFGEVMVREGYVVGFENLASHVWGRDDDSEFGAEVDFHERAVAWNCVWRMSEFRNGRFPTMGSGHGPGGNEVAEDGDESSYGEHDGAVWILCVEDRGESEARRSRFHFLPDKDQSLCLRDFGYWRVWCCVVVDKMGAWRFIL
ncbi:hypothetical protein HID58_001254, partial [Brassica napus]